MAQVPRYKSFFEKAQVFKNIRHLEHEVDVNAYFKELDGQRNYFYRGLTRSSYKLYTTGQRYWIEKELEGSGLFEDYASMFGSFLYHLKTSPNMPFSELMRRWGLDGNDDLALLSYLQHANAPTPLLDFTENPYVALYFASSQSGASSGLEEFEPDKYFSVVTFPRDADGPMNLQYKNAVERNRARVDMDAGKVYAGFMFFSEGLALVLCQEALKDILGEGRGQLVNNLNIINQKGLFVYNSTAEIPLVELIRLNEMTHPDPTPNKRWISNEICCVDIHRDLAGYVRDRLAALDPPVNEKSIFPDPKYYFESFIAGR